MRLQESLKIQSLLKTYGKKHKSFDHVINLGSGNIERLKKTKPWVSQNVFNPLEKSGAKVIHVDAEGFPGVDIVQDLSLPNALKFCDKLKGSKLFILANNIKYHFFKLYSINRKFITTFYQ